jgi:multisubunit Na+/H+ antiporter MnhC subunit
MSTCDDLNCYASKTCCEYMNGQPYCQVASQCRSDPVWQAIVIPAVLFLLAVCLIIVVVYKLRTKRFSSMQVKNFARQEMYLFF